MDAAKLYEVVEDVPRDAWPDVVYRPGESKNNFYGRWIIADGRISPESAELLFIGSMVKWLGIVLTNPESRTWTSMTHLSYGEHGCTLIMSGFKHPEIIKTDRPTLVEALAAACTAASKGA
jgi:hypothetical protein